MFKSAKWRSEKNKIKSVFKLQFHGTQDSSRFGAVGEVSIDFASYAEATKISSLSLPLKNAKSAAVLHVSPFSLTVQATSDQRDIDGKANVSHHDVSLRTLFGNGDTKDDGTCNGINRDHQSSIGSDIMLPSSDSSSGLDTPHKHDPKLTHESSIAKDRFSRCDWLNGSAPKSSTGDSSTITLGEIFEESSSETMIQNLKVKVAGLTRQANVSELELQTLRKKIMNDMKKGQDISKEVSVLKEERNALKKECEKLKAEEVKVKTNDMLLENHDISFKLERSQLQEQLKMQYECSPYTTLDELETQIESLEDDLESKSKELSKSNLVIKEHESHIKTLEEELENQGHEFETNLEELMLAKTNQEQRAIRAEDNLRKMRLHNANAATRLQDELRRLSQKMASTFEVNEKAAMKAMDEANKLRVEKRVLEDTLMKVKKDLQDLGDRFQEKLVFLEVQVTLKSKQLQKIKKKIENVIEIHNLEIERLKELAIDCSENLFLHKEKDLQLEIKDMERKSDILVQKTKKSQVYTL
ncbi:hypothetical protein L1987_02935 [Smallanthus sonchifolius]|uniref:Uncharacterized protein n=1 Tax=Smallanthus sonchifolius TaxID=185202 RepID=A0ACB9K964_9ASTR|nr:hypothetical protein L1987_02935 [Smallanthus sonchifolius]